MLAINTSGQSPVRLHLADVGMIWNWLLLPTSFIVRNRKRNKIIAGTNLRVLAIFFSSCVINRIQFDQFIVYKAHAISKTINYI
jgi:hypothetical protein